MQQLQRGGGDGEGVAGRRWWGKQKPVKATVEGFGVPARLSLGFALAFIFAVRHCCSCCLSAYCCRAHIHPQTVAYTERKKCYLNFL